MAKKMTMDDLARMTAEGFKGVEKQVTAEVGALRADMETGFNRIENLLLRDHLNRIEHLEDAVLQLKVKVGMR